MSQTLIAQFTPYFQNYSLSEYNAGNQNWGVSRAENGLLYVANNNGLLEYDGIKWDLLELPNKTTIRSVFAYKNLIYTGSYEEFGYWKKNFKGTLVYNSLSDAIKDKISPNEEIWQILPFKEGIAFRSFLNVYIYKFNGEIRKIKPKSIVISCSVVDNKLYVATLHNGIYEFKNNELVLKIMDKVLDNTKVLFITNYKGKLLIITSLKGCLIYENNTLKPLDFEINDIIRQHLLNGFSLLNNGNMAFGTIKDGIYFTNNKGKVIFHINKGNGLINNTVLSQYIDSDNKLWLGLDNGIACVDLNNNNLFFNDVSGRLGAVYDVIKYKGVIYLGSNTGLFYLDKGNTLQFVKGSQGQVWNLKEIEGELFCGHNEGTFLVKDYTLKLVSSVTGGWVIKKIPEQNNTYIQGTYTGLVRLKKTNNIWKAKRLGETTMPIKYLVFENQNTAWVAHAYKGLYKVKFDKNYDTITNIKNYNTKGVFSDFNIRVYKIKNDICFKTNDGWLKYESILDTIVSYDLLNKNFGRDSYIISEEDVNQLVLKTTNNAITFKSLLNNEKEISLSNNYFENRLIVGNENVSKINDSIFALNLNNGFMLIDSKSDSKTKLYKPTIDNIEIDKGLIDFDLNKKISIKLNSSFGVSVSSPKSNNHFFEYSILELDSTKWKKLEKNKLELSSLKDGTYTLLFRTRNYLGRSSKVSKIQLNVLPPWYKDTIGIVLYLVLIALSIGAFYYYNKQKIKREQRLLKIKYAKEQQEIVREKNLENEKRIVQLKNESLSNEVKLKSKQLANTALALVKKNETLQDIKKELANNKDSFDNQYAFKKILNKVDSSIAHKDEWKVFEYNFNQVHEDFFKSLKSKHSNLTPKDLKICAYIKMNLSNKEIAPLMNVSVRGLETHRYRLKRKLELENDISVSDYLTNLN
ncbi:LuxR C-terminal-related transcriptional regulator [Mariniflexile litorale]|uniref:LuxR C-terminal-related transcriptional regulator n=1 Tax=Mariniflexile litorale TaxID=3045158 RepID=A0AAU7ED44_9FLAO|nr:LuxR C-terminal-related transcriptional regulator [Mariniflexile sp. KMM 9835]MDQ8212126.1 LuxR C-terminal-related transcriptional regulator [Mariniflexile sp. KMM 9835]